MPKSDFHPTWQNEPQSKDLISYPQIQVESLIPHQRIPSSGNDPSIRDSNIEGFEIALGPSKEYENKPLPTTTSIWLLHLFPGKGYDKIQCCLQICEMDKAPEYEAISYVWGDPRVTVAVVADRRILPVTTKLRDALLTVRRERSNRLLWADTVCIN